MITLKEQMNLKDRVALITGGGGHLGYVMAEALSELGANLIIVDCDKDAANKVVSDVQKKYAIKAIAVIVDLEQPKFAKTVLQAVEKEFGQLDILVNNAAFCGAINLKGWAVDFEDQSVETWRRALEVNLTGPFALIQACLKLLKASKKASVINVCSIYGVVGPNMKLYENTDMGNPAAYAASKGGLIQLTRWLATTLAPTIRVNAISPGGIWRDHPESFHQQYVARTPLKRMASEEDFKGAIAYFASDLSAYVTGQNLLVDGGWTSW